MSSSRPEQVPSERTPEVRAVLAWLDAHERDVDEAPLWNAFLGTTDMGDQLRIVQSRIEHRPSKPFHGLGRGPAADPARRRATIIVGYLRGVFSATDLPTLDPPWPWGRVCGLAVEADESGEEGWGSYLQEDFARSALRAAIARGDLSVPRAPVDLEARLRGFLSGLAGVLR